ncbi:hypothetical protein KTD31_02330 [Burkholderia multivorans]|jgi:hypothetical protein|uniref:hypothetical protein n=1 Tax=Burkholderia multivorans TaxID=87883 RepID=UPI001C24EC7D|nr:hypothetical protein [Burkholderia multivorans]MBU9200242.1 hypothetical protein [Burkholderia multivorans]MDN8078631.1 hypothetical protein [Burkholderia multivorans]
MPNISGLLFKKFYNDEAFWDGETYHDDVLIKADNGAVWADSDDLHSIPETAFINIESGWVNEVNPELTGGTTDMSLKEFFELWQSRQAVPLRVLLVECTAEEEERVRAAILAAGGKISA